MCGICGEYRFDDSMAAAGAVAAMADAMAARGPDAAGLYMQDRVALGHRRLRIIDLSDASRQPMVDSELGLSIAFNGAIYNYRDLRDELEAKGYRFFSEGDTEVLIKAYHAWGEGFVERLNGMFALAIAERESGRMVLARDRLGIKPLYYATDDRRLRFASSMPALLAGGEVDTAIDPVALHRYMTFHSVVPAPHTILKGVRKLPPATVMTVEPSGETRMRRYWSIAFGPRAEERDLDERDWEGLVLDGLRQAVRRRLVADVPVGALLSGGLDSSLIVGLLAECGVRPKTFSIGFESAGGEAGDEFHYSDLIAERFQTDHTRMEIASDRILPALDRCVAAMSEPMMSHDCVAFFLLSEEVSRHVRVVQSGQGADEVFGGYHWYPPMTDSTDPVADYARVFFDRDHAGARLALGDAFLDGDPSRSFVAEHFAQAGAESAVDKALRIDQTVMLVDDPVKRVDNMTMAFGLEARVPFLDHELVELAARIPAPLKIRDGGKAILKNAARQVIPAAVIDRPKGYFPVPALKYLRGPFLEMATDLLRSGTARRRGLFQEPFLDAVIADPDAHITPLRGATLWQMAVLEYWLQTHRL